MKRRRNLYNKEYRIGFISALGKVKEKLSDKYSAEEAANEIIKTL